MRTGLGGKRYKKKDNIMARTNATYSVFRTEKAKM
jgi:hypothetical protein